MNNMERLPADTFFLDLELRQEVERMASQIGRAHV